jgi:hypothetical protein
MLATAGSLAVGVIVWFGLAFGTRSWWRQWLAAVVAGLAMAWWNITAMQDIAASTGAEPLSFLRFAGISTAGMVLLASAGMGLFQLLQRSRAGG